VEVVKDPVEVELVLFVRRELLELIGLLQGQGCGLSTTQFENAIHRPHRQRERRHIATALAARRGGAAFTRALRARSGCPRIVGRFVRGDCEGLIGLAAGVPFEHGLLPQMPQLFDVLIAELEIALVPGEHRPLVRRQPTQVSFHLLADLVDAKVAELMFARHVAIRAAIDDDLAIDGQVALGWWA
jgi:hypothetical protein